MSDMTDRITAVLREHERYGSRCECGTDVRFSTPQKHAVHVAEQIAALFTEEWGVVRPNGDDEPHQVFDFRGPADEQAAWRIGHGISSSVVSRLVSDWAAVEDQL